MDTAHPGHQLSDAATRIFLERGFDAVRVANVAEACCRSAGGLLQSL